MIKRVQLLSEPGTGRRDRRSIELRTQRQNELDLSELRGVVFAWL